MSKRDYYEVLGVGREADAASLKKAYRRIAMKYHPDRNSDDPEAADKFKEANEAYEVLSNEEKKAAYDRFGHAGVDPNMGGRGGAGGFGGGEFTDIFGDVFGDIFGGGGRRRQQRGADLQYNLELTLEEAVAGVNKSIRVTTNVTCNTCGGSGAKEGSKPETCTTCGGAGQVRMSQGFFSVQQTCPKCQGTGQIISDPCGDCRGKGTKPNTRTLSVKIPSGVDTGDRIRLSGEGEAGPQGTAPGDLYVQVVVKDHPVFERDGNNLYCEIPVSMVDAALGSEIEMPTLSGKVKLTVPAESQTGKLFRLRGKGVKPARGGSTGDLICRIVVETPVKLTREQKDILEQLREPLSRDKHSPQRSSWFDTVRSFFDNLHP